MLHLWDDLERWANEDKAEALGVFEIDFADKRFHVGLPIAQVVLDEEERKALHTIFAEAGLDPQSPPTDQELAAQVTIYGKDKLNRRTIRLLDEPSNDKQLSAVLTSVIRTELLDWDGVAASSEQQGEGEGRYFGTLKLCCQIKRVAERAQFTFRCRATNPFPEGKLSLTLNGRTVGYCEEVVPTWSSFVTAGAGGRTVDASAFDWQSGLVLKNEQNSWSFKLPASSVRILVNGAEQGLPGLIEVRQLPEGQNFYLAVSDELGPLLEKWGNSSCVGFRRFEITDGLPDNWRLYYAEAVLRSGALAPTRLPMLTLPTNVRLRFSGGVRSSRGNHYYNFARPI